MTLPDRNEPPAAVPVRQGRCGGRGSGLHGAVREAHMNIGTIGTGQIVREILKGVQMTEGVSCGAVYSRKRETGAGGHHSHAEPPGV